MTLVDFQETQFTHQGTTRNVYRKGTGPGVLIMHEIPGITPSVANFARRVEAEGFTVFMPHLFGTPERPLSFGYAAGQLLRACISKEFSVWAANQASPITEWLRALGRQMHQELRGKGIGALGMCLTGNFALALMIDPFLMAPVLSQPSLPFSVGKKRAAGLHLSPESLVTIKRRIQEENVKVIGLRFTNDPLCRASRFETLRRELGDGFEGIEIDSSRGNPHHISWKAHSVVTNDLVDQEGHPTRTALDRVLQFFQERLKT
jgi:dienelactone hydrolase